MKEPGSGVTDRGTQGPVECLGSPCRKGGTVNCAPLPRISTEMTAGSPISSSHSVLAYSRQDFLHSYVMSYRVSVCTMSWNGSVRTLRCAQYGIEFETRSSVAKYCD